MTRILNLRRANGRERNVPDDAALAGMVRRALDAAAGVSAAAVSIRADHGTVILRGEVDHIDDIDGYELAAREVPGVVDVDNLLRLRLAGRTQQQTQQQALPA